MVDRNQLCALLAMRTFLAFGLCLRRQTVRGTVLLPTVGSVAICVRTYVKVFCVSFTIILLYMYINYVISISVLHCVIYGHEIAIL